MASLLKECRICFSFDTETSELISPCLCSGTSAFIHRHCLKTWVEESGQKQCSSCQAIYSSHTIFKKLSEWKFLDSYPAECFFLLAELLVLLILGYINYNFYISGEKYWFAFSIPFQIVIYVFICVLLDLQLETVKLCLEMNSESTFGNHPVHTVK